MEMREKSVEDAVDQTCTWVLTNECYQDWIETSPGLLWILGKPGAGKSTLMKFVHTQAIDSGALVVAFYFNGHGAAIEKTSAAMYRSLLYQLLPHASQQQQEKMNKVYLKRCRTRGPYLEAWTWHEAELSKALQEVVADLRNPHIRMYIDALDEAGQDIAVNLVSEFQEMPRKAAEAGTTLKICFSCRHFPIIAMEGLTIRVEDENTRDIELYVRQKLMKASIPPDQIEMLADAVTARANGVFQWVKIVLKRVLVDSRAWVRTVQILRRLQEIPAELDDLYQKLLSEIDTDDDRRQCVNLMRWMCFATRSLRLAELRHALCLQPDTIFSSLHELESQTFYIDNHEDMEIRIIAISRGLVEIQSHETVGNIAVFVHESVENFLVERGGLKKLEGLPTLDDQLIAAHACLRLAWRNIRYLEAFVMDETSVDVAAQINLFPLIIYALDNWFFNPVVEEGDSILVDEFYKLFIYMGHPREGPNRLQKWAARMMLFNPIDATESKQGRDLDAFELAALSGQYKVASMLAADCRALHRVTIFEWAVFTHKILPAFAPYLLDGNLVDTNEKNASEETALHVVLKAANVKFLRNQRNNVIVQESQVQLQRQLATLPSEEISWFRMLLKDKNVDVNIQDKEGRTPLHVAAQAGLLAPIQMLLDSENINVNCQDYQGMTALQFAVGLGMPEVVEALLGHECIDVNAPNFEDMTALHLSVASENARITQLLLGHKEVDVNPRVHTKFTPLYVAIGQNSPELVEMLLAHKDIDVNAQFDNGHSTLYAAVTANLPELVKLLLGHKNIDLHTLRIDGKVLCASDVVVKTPGIHQVIIAMVKQKHEEQILNQGITRCYYKNGQSRVLERTQEFISDG